MEEGPEPQEWVERAAEEHHHGHTAAAGAFSTTLPAITAAVLAVLASLGSLLSGHAANEAILAMIRTTDQWAEFQSTSTKGHLYEVGAELVKHGSPDPRYRRWIDTYADDEYQTIVAEVLALADNVGPTLCAADEARARAHFATTARYEWMFWDAAWRREAWPV